MTHKKDATTTIKRLKRHFGTHGIPLKIMSDNGPPFNSHEFSNFVHEYEMEHVTSSPEFPQSNGKAESAVKIAKHLIRKTNKGHRDAVDFTHLEKHSNRRAEQLPCTTSPRKTHQNTTSNEVIIS
jgi:transposase InsO family protein